MKKKPTGIITALSFITALAGIGSLIFFPEKFFREKKAGEQRQARIIDSQAPAVLEDPSAAAERLAREDRLSARIAMDEGEIVIAVLNGNFDEDPQEEQIIAYRRPQPASDRGPLDGEEPVYIAYAGYDEALGGYRRLWSAPAAASRPLTLSLYTQDLLGDRSVCILVSGMNNAGEHTLTVFRVKSPGEDTPPFAKIADIRIEGAISVQETGRTQAYQLGLARGQSFLLTAYGRDPGSANILDQREITYTYNAEKGVYEESRITRVPGRELEQRRVRELLSGSPGSFESFITGLWYYVSPQGTVDSRQYIYFDPPNRELVFYGDETQQVFTWQNSSATRYGLYISSQNISVTTLRRFLDIELESLDSIRIKVFEDVRLKLGVSAPWDGSYRRAAIPQDLQGRETAAVFPYRDAVYEGSPGRLRLFRDGSYELSSGGTVRRGNYIFFPLKEEEILELRSREPRSADSSGGELRDTYLVERSAGREGERLSLRRIRLGARGIQELPEPAISLTEVF